MMPSPITRSDRPLTNGERLAAWYEAARRHAMRADSFVFKASQHHLLRLFLKAGDGDGCEAEVPRGVGQE
jgi:hypothetical protein